MNGDTLSILTGLMVGIVFGFLKLPIPAPSTSAGMFGLMGIFFGYIIITKYVK